MPGKADKTILNGTALIHSDDVIGPEVAPSISVTTTYRHPVPGPELVREDEIDSQNPSRHVYSRYTQDVSTRAEKILGAINHGEAITYTSGLAAAYAALLLYKPKRIAINGGYFGCHETIRVYADTRPGVQMIDLDDEYQDGDLCWLETPVNPTGEARDIKYYADKIHAVGGPLVVDATFAPPPLQYPFKWGADCIMHSATKYFGGHSDLLAGVLIVKSKDQWKTLFHNRTYTGGMAGSLESWLLLRSLRTLHLRVARQSQNATILAKWLDAVSKTPNGENFDGVPGGVVTKVYHTSLQGKNARGWEPSQQMEGGWNATFSILLATPEYAIKLPHTVRYFVAATSLGGVESLMERRFDCDSSSDPSLVRVSVGVEDVEDLKTDLRKAFQQLSTDKAKL